MRHALLAFLLIAGPLACGPARAQTAPPPAPAAPVDPIEKAYDDAVLKDGTVDPEVARLTALSNDTSKSDHERSSALLLASHLQWRFGRIPAATDSIEAALAIESTADLALQKARLLEAAGDLPGARSWYEEALSQTTDAQQKEDVRLRLTFLATDAQSVDALVKLAKSRDRAFRNRAAVALAILGHDREASDLYEVSGDDPAQLQRAHLRVAQWALKARKAKEAQDEAWQAALLSTIPRDLRYSLSILVEAHELDKSWDKLLARFASQPNPSPDMQAVRVDVLHRLKRYDEAIAIIESQRGQDSGAEGRRLLLRLYGEAGKDADMIAEFDKLIAKDPADPSWVRGLSEHFMEEGKRDQAMQTWKDFIARNSGADALLDGGEAMDQLGFEDLALAAGDKCAATHPETVTRVGWYRFEISLRHGETAKAEAILAGIEGSLPKDAPGLADVADAYERLRNPRRAIAVWETLSHRENGLGVDEKMRLAWLYDTVGERDKALDIWKKLWQGTIPEASRKLVEDRLLLLAAETGGLGDIAIDIERKLEKGQAGAKEASLLVRIYTEIGDAAAAVEVIQENFGRQEKTPAAEIESLKEQASVYQALGRHAAFNEVTERLLKLDPKNSSDYLQGLILSTIDAGTPKERDDLPKRLLDLRAVTDTAGEEFEAGVLVMAGMQGKAIDSYRRALARSPGHSDDYLLLADLLKKSGKPEEGIAILQYFAEIAPGDDGFMTAIDGILNVQPPANSPVLAWAQRRVLERITQHDDKYYLYDLASEIADAAHDTNTYLSALENALVEAGPRRSSVLRELVSATEQKQQGFLAAPTSKADSQRNLSYSRRLIALGEELPPDVYLDLGHAFLGMGNPSEALNAFNLAIDRTDRTSLVEESADQFEAAGFSGEASVLYEKALTFDADNVGVMAKLAGDRSREGAAAQANALYLRGLLKVTAQQLPEIEGASSAVYAERRPSADVNFTSAYKKYAAALQTGLVFTLDSVSTPGAGDPAPLAALEGAFDGSLAETVQRAGKAPRALTAYPRLAALAQIARFCALATGDYPMADRIDFKLLKGFGNDAPLVSELVEKRMDWGLRSSAERLRTAPGVAPAVRDPLAARTAPGIDAAALTSLSALAKQALSQGKFQLAATAALAAGDHALVYSIFQDWLASVRDAKPDPDADNSMFIVYGTRRGGILHVVAEAGHDLDPAQYSAFCRLVADTAASSPSIARDLILGSSRNMFTMTQDRSALFGIEAAAGRRLFTPELLAATLASIDDKNLTALDQDYVLAALPPADRVALFLRLTQPARTRAGSFSEVVPAPAPAIASFGILLAQPMDPASAQKVSDALKQRFQQYAKSGMASYMPLDAALARVQVSVTVDKANEAMLADLDRYMAETYPASFGKGSFRGLFQPAFNTDAHAMEIVFEGISKQAAKAATDTSARGRLATPLARYKQYVNGYADTIYPNGKAELLALIDRKAAAKPSPDLFWFALAVLTDAPAGTLRDQVSWLEGVLRREPDSKLALEAVYPLYKQLGQTDKEAAVLEHLIATSKEAGAYRSELATLWRGLDHPENAIKALGVRPSAAAPAALSDEDRMAQAFARLQDGTSSRNPKLNAFVAELSKPDQPDGGEQALRGLLLMLPPSGGSTRNPFMGFDGGVDYQTLLELTVKPSPASASAPAARAVAGRRGAQAAVTAPALAALESDNDPSAANAAPPAGLLDQLAGKPFAAGEFEAVVRTLDPTAPDSDGHYRFYGLLADAYAKNGRLAAEFARLDGIVSAGKAGKKEMLLWMELAVRQSPATVRDLTDAARKALFASGTPAGYQAVQLARLYARGGRQDEAAAIYGSIAVNVMGDLGGDDFYSRFRGRPPLLSLTGLFTDAEGCLDGERLARFMGQLLEIAKPHGQASFEPAHRQFVIWIVEEGRKAQLPPDRLRAAAESIDLAGASHEGAIAVAGMMSRLFPAEKALPALRLALRQDAVQPPADASGGLFAIGEYDGSSGSYSKNLGVSPPSLVRGAPKGLSAASFKGLFPAGADAWPGAREWVVAAAQAVAGWTASGEAEPDLSLQVLALLTLRESQMGLPEAAGSARAISAALARFDAVPMTTATLAVAAADRARTPVDPAVLAKLVVNRRIEVRQLAPLVARVAETGGAPAAIALGSPALQYTENDAFLEEMETLARKSGDDAEGQRLAALRQRAAKARTALLRL